MIGKSYFTKSDDQYRVDKTPGIIDERWRIKCNSYPVDNRGFGQHRNILNQMQGRDTRDSKFDPNPSWCYKPRGK